MSGASSSCSYTSEQPYPEFKYTRLHVQRISLDHLMDSHFELWPTTTTWCFVVYFIYLYVFYWSVFLIPLLDHFCDNLWRKEGDRWIFNPLRKMDIWIGGERVSIDIKKLLNLERVNIFEFFNSIHTFIKGNYL